MLGSSAHGAVEARRTGARTVTSAHAATRQQLYATTAAVATRRVVTKAARAAAVTRPLHYIAPDGVTSARVLPNVPQHYSQLRCALSVLQQQLDKLLCSSNSRDRVEGGLAAAAVCIVVHRAWSKEAATAGTASHNAQAAHTDAAATNAARTARFVSRATEQAAQLLLSAANGTNTLPDIQWDSFPAAIRQQLLTLFQQQGWVSTLGFPILQKQLPYERPMGLSQYHSFLTNNPYYIAYWDEDFWVDQITPTPAHCPWLHPRQLHETLTEDQVLSLSAQLPAFQAVMEAAVAASILPEQLLQARQAADNSPTSTVELFTQHWVKQAGAAVSATAASILSKRKAARLAPTPARRPSILVSRLFGPLQSPPMTSGFTSGGADGVGRVEDFGDGSGGRCYGAVTAVGSGDEGNRPGGLASVTPYGDAQQQSDLAGGAEGIQDADIAATFQD